MNLPETGLVVMVSHGCPVCARAGEIVTSVCPEGLESVIVADDEALFTRYRVDRVPFLLVRREGRDAAWGPIETFGCSPRAIRAAIEEIVEGYEPGDLRPPEPPRARAVRTDCRGMILALADLLVRIAGTDAIDDEAMADATRRVRALARRLGRGGTRR